MALYIDSGIRCQWTVCSPLFCTFCMFRVMIPFKSQHLYNQKALVEINLTVCLRRLKTSLLPYNCSQWTSVQLSWEVRIVGHLSSLREFLTIKRNSWQGARWEVTAGNSPSKHKPLAQRNSIVSNGFRQAQMKTSVSELLWSSFTLKIFVFLTLIRQCWLDCVVRLKHSSFVTDLMSIKISVNNLDFTFLAENAP